MLVCKLLLSYFSECLNIYLKSSTGGAHMDHFPVYSEFLDVLFIIYWAEIGFH